MIELRKINRHFKNGNDTNHILKDIHIDEGEYLFNNENFQKSSDNKLTEIRNHTVGFVFQNFKLIQSNTILENVSIPLIYNGMGSK